MTDRQDGQDPDRHENEPRRDQDRTVVEEFKVRSEDVIARVKELVREGNVRRITIKNEEGRTLVEIPLAVGVLGTLLLPAWAAIGAIAALVANLTIAVERRADEATTGSDATDGLGGSREAGGTQNPSGQDATVRGDDLPRPRPAGDDMTKGEDVPG